MQRREFLKYLGLGTTGSAFGSMLNFKEKQADYLVPFLETPDGVTPGAHTWYSTVCRQCPAGCGLKVKVREGRAKKLEGHHLSPINEGKLCARGQAGLQVLYNPDRVKGPLVRSKKGMTFSSSTWQQALSVLSRELREVREISAGESVVFLSQALRGNLANLISTFMGRIGSENFFSYDVFDEAALRAANDLCFGYDAIPDYHLEKANYVLSIGAGLLDTWISPVRYSVGYGKMRDTDQGNKGSRGWLVQFEPRQSLTGASADQWFPMNPGAEGVLALSMAHVILDAGWHSPSLAPVQVQTWLHELRSFSAERATQETGVPHDIIRRIAREFSLAQPGLAIVGGSATAQVNGVFNAVAANILNLIVGNLGREGGLRFPELPPFSQSPESMISLNGLLELVDRMNSGEVKILFLNQANPAFSLPSEVGFSEALKNVPLVISFSSIVDESTALSDMVLPDHTPLESWGDYIPLADTGRRVVGVMQPVVRPLYDSRSVGDVILTLSEQTRDDIGDNGSWRSFQDYLQTSWKGFYDERRQAGLESAHTFEEFWRDILMRGGWWEENATSDSGPPLPPPAVAEAKILSKVTFQDQRATRGFEHNLHIYPSNGLFDGRGASQPWLQELPEPLVSATWGSWVELNPETAKNLGVKEGDLTWIESPSGKIKAPVYIYPAIGPTVVAVPCGQGHAELGRYARGRGANPFDILMPHQDHISGSLAWAATKVKVYPAGERAPIVKTEHTTEQLGRMIVQTVTADEAAELLARKEDRIEALPSRGLNPRGKNPAPTTTGLGRYRSSRFHRYRYRWGMVIDLDKCTGCEACMVSCRAENNIPFAGPKEAARNRSINWIRVDRYWEGTYPKIRANLIPVNCYQCGNAPCEPVCPVAAAYHTQDGLDAQIYNRCIGTRFCGANCPYKARNFNWLNPKWPAPLDQQLNSDLSVRSAGIMEKCTFCVQRIRATKARAKTLGRKIEDGEIQPACVQTCPSGAMVFGNLVDHESRVSLLTRSARRFRVLEEWNTEPAVIYLKAVRDDE